MNAFPDSENQEPTPHGETPEGQSGERASSLGPETQKQPALARALARASRFLATLRATGADALKHTNPDTQKPSEELDLSSHIDALYSITADDSIQCRLIAALQYYGDLPWEGQREQSPHIARQHADGSLAWEIQLRASGDKTTAGAQYEHYAALSSDSLQGNLGTLRIRNPDGSRDELPMHTLAATIKAELDETGAIQTVRSLVEINTQTPSNPNGSIVFEVSRGSVTQLYVDGRYAFTSPRPTHPSGKANLYVIAASEALNDVLNALSDTLYLYEGIRSITEDRSGPQDPLT